MNLSALQKRFCEEYLVDQDETQAAIRSGIPEETAAKRAEQMLANVMVCEHIDQLLHEQAAATQIYSEGKGIPFFQ